MKKYIMIILAAILMVSSLAACGKLNETVKAADSVSKKNGDQLSIVTTIFPEYDWVKNILGADSEASVTMLLDNGVDLHSFQPSVDDIVKISNCDLFIYVGGESDEWVDDVLKQATNKNMKVIDLLDVLGDAVKAEEIVEGMEHEHDHEDGDEHHHEHEEELDEHVWLSLKNASVLCEAITEALCEIDTSNKEKYQANLESYQAKLTALDGEYAETVESAKYKTLLFGDRFPFRYLVDDYGLAYYAAFAGCSAESEASFETVVFLAEKLDELKLPAILTIEGKNQKIAETIRSTSKAKDQEILTMNSMQATTSKDVSEGASYLGIMTENLEVLRKAIQ